MGIYKNLPDYTYHRLYLVTKPLKIPLNLNIPTIPCGIVFVTLILCLLDAANAAMRPRIRSEYASERPYRPWNNRSGWQLTWLTMTFPRQPQNTRQWSITANDNGKYFNACLVSGFCCCCDQIPSFSRKNICHHHLRCSIIIPGGSATCASNDFPDLGQPRW